MQRFIGLLVFSVLFFSCGKKEVKVENKETLETVDNDLVLVADETVVDKPELFFTVQIAALNNKNETLENLDNIHIYNENSLTKYRLGNFQTYKEAKDFQLQIRSQYKGAFVQALKNNYPIHIIEALKN